MAILKFRAYYEEDDSVYRDVVIKHTQSFLDLHYAILKSWEFDNKHKATFYRSNDNWQRGREISLEGRYGAYVTDGETNATLPKSIDKDQLTLEEAAQLIDARTDENFVIMARTDALAVDGLDAAIDRAIACVEAGADMIFPEAMTELAMYKQFANALKVPVLANITEFGSTPLFTVEELKTADVGIVLYPLSAFRAMNKAAQAVYQTIRQAGTQQAVLPLMQTRKELYDAIGYWDYESRLDALFAKGKS